MLIPERGETRASGMVTEVKRRKDKKHIQMCQDIILDEMTSLLFVEKIKINISKDCLTKRYN